MKDLSQELPAQLASDADLRETVGPAGRPFVGENSELFETLAALVTAHFPAYGPDAMGVGFFFAGVHLAWVLRPRAGGGQERTAGITDWVDPKG